RFDQQLSSSLMANILFYIAQQLAAHAARLRLFAHGNPIQMPTAIRHGCGGVVSETDDLTVVLISNGTVSVLVHQAVVVIEDLLQGFDLDEFEDTGDLRESHEHRSIVRYGRTDHEAVLGKADAKVTSSRDNKTFFGE